MEGRLQIKRRHPIRKFLIIMAVFFLVIFGGYLLISQTFQLNEFVVEGCTQYSDEEIKEKLMSKSSDSITFLMYLRYKFTDHKEIPFIESYSVSMEGNHTIKVKVYEKIMIGCVELMGNYMYFDREGVVVESSKERINRVPLIAGLKFDKIVLHEQLEIQKSSLYDMILNLTKLIQKFELNVDKVFINSSYEVTLTCEGNEFLLGKRDFYDTQISEIPNILKEAENMKLRYDMRYYEEENKKITAKPLN